jgi:ABC-2 type transport system ATP-binding protein
MSILATEHRPSGGDAVLFGHSLRREPRVVRQMIGLAPQEIALYPMLSAAENLRFFGHVYGVRGEGLENRIDELLHFVGLKERGNDYVATFSGGMRRRLNLAVALVHRPTLILLDEPITGVDPQSREHILEIVRRLRQAGCAILYTTHYMEEAEQLCDRLGILDHGKLLAMDALGGLLADMQYAEIIEMRGLPSGADLAPVRAAGGVCRIESNREVVRLFVRSAANLLGPLQRLINRSGRNVKLQIAPLRLEDLFLHLTGKELRD